MAKLVKQYFTSSGSWTAPAGITEALIIAAGGGGGGGAGGSVQAGSGGGGAIQKHVYVSVTPNTSYTITIGSGGAGGNGSPIAGADGGTTSFGTIAYFKGGAGGDRDHGGSNVAGLTGNVTTQIPAGGGIGSSGTPAAGNKNWVGNGSYTGGSAGTGSIGGGGGGAGPQGNGANGGNATANGSNASANTGAGGGGGGTAGGGTTGGNGGSGYLYVIWVD